MSLICAKSNNDCGKCDHRFPHEPNGDCKNARCSRVGYIDCVLDIKKIRKLKLLKLNDKLSDT